MTTEPLRGLLADELELLLADKRRYRAAFVERYGQPPADAVTLLRQAKTIDELVFRFAGSVADALYARQIAEAVLLADAYADREAELLGHRPRTDADK